MTPGTRIRDLRTNRTGVFIRWFWHCGYKRALVKIDGKLLQPLGCQVVRVRREVKCR